MSFLMSARRPFLSVIGRCWRDWREYCRRWQREWVSLTPSRSVSPAGWAEEELRLLAQRNRVFIKMMVREVERDVELRYRWEACRVYADMERQLIEFSANGYN